MKFGDAIETMNERKHAAFDGKFAEGDVAPRDLWALCAVGLDIDIDELIESADAMASTAIVLMMQFDPGEVLRTLVADAAVAGALLGYEHAKAERSEA